MTSPPKSPLEEFAEDCAEDHEYLDRLGHATGNNRHIQTWHVINTKLERLALALKAELDQRFKEEA